MTAPEKHSRALQAMLVAMLLFIGVELWFLVMHGLGIRRYQPILIGVAALLAIFPPLARWIASMLDRIARPSRGAARLTAIFLFVASAALFYFQARSQERSFSIRYHDE